MTLKNLLITGATGQQGGALIRALMASPKPAFHIYALTRNASTPRAKLLASNPHITLIEGDTRNPLPIFTSISTPIHGVFSVTALKPFKSADFETSQAIPLIDAAVAHGVKHFIFTSVHRGLNSATDPTPVPHFQTKFEIEKHLEKSGLKHTILRPVTFFDNLSSGFGRPFATMWRQMGEARLAFVAARDIGLVAARAFEKERFGVVTVVGDQLSFAEAEAVFSGVVGEEMPRSWGFVGTLVKWGIRDMGEMFRWFAQGGYGHDLEKEIKEERLMGFREWLRESKFVVK